MSERLSTVSLDVQIASVERELALRRRVFPRWVESRRTSANEAEREIACMQAVLGTPLHCRDGGSKP